MHIFVTHGPKIPTLYEGQVNILLGNRTENPYQYSIDSEGDNISSLNHRFCELTGLYWFWKNSKIDKNKFVSFNHYRRWFVPNELEKRFSTDFDFIVPNTYNTFFSLEDHFKFHHIEQGWNVVLEVLDQFEKDSSEHREFFSKNNKLIPYNMFVCKFNTLDQLCSWLFPILFEINRRIHFDDIPYQSRFLGFVSERLLTYYYHQKRVKFCYIEGSNPRKRINHHVKNFVSDIGFHYIWKKNLVHK